MRKGDKSEKFPIPDNVAEFMDKAAVKYGQIQGDAWSQAMWGDCRGISSPIEQLFWIALQLVAEHNLVEIEDADKFIDRGDELQVIRQWQCGSYRVDYALRRHPIDKIICVELDGHKFHDTNERQRSYEKQRDRFLGSKGYQVLHFTGADVTRNPCAVALEAFIAATNLGDAATHPFED